jgi:hypothetical protein
MPSVNQGPIEPAFLALLTDAPTVAAAHSGDAQAATDAAAALAALAALATGGVHIGAPSQDERRPCIAVNVIDEEDHHTLTKHSGYATGIVQVDCLAPTAKDARLLARAARAILDSAAGVIADCNIDWIKVAGSRRLPRLPLQGKALPLFGLSLDCAFMYRV